MALITIITRRLGCEINTLTRLNSRMKREGRNILMFLDNAPCHPASLKGMFPNVRIEFLPKHTTSCTKPLEAGIINTWKVHYRRKLLRYVLSQVDGKSTVSSEIVKSVDLLVAVRWMVSAWEEVEPEVISRCFKRVGMFPEEFGSMQEEDDPSAGEELLDLEALVTKVTGEICHDVAAYVTNADHDATPYEPYVDSSEPNWRENLRSDVIAKHSQSNVIESDDDAAGDFDHATSEGWCYCACFPVGGVCRLAGE